MIHIKDWKLAEITRENRGGYLVEIFGIARETEKAALVSMRWGYTSSLERNINAWVPKSALMNDEEYGEEIKRENERLEAACDKYNALIEFAKDNGIRAYSGMRKETILKKIRESGLVYND